MAFTTPGTAVAGDVLTAAFWNTNVRDNMVELAPFFTGWTSWTPALTGSGFTITQGNSTVVGKYLKVGRFVTFWAQWVFGSTTSFGAGVGGLSLTIPVQAADARNLSGVQSILLDNGTAHYPGLNRAVDNTTTIVNITSILSSGTYSQQGSISSTIPFTWVVNDAVYWSGTYEAAS